jgi:outer membrane receptor for ferrienterochelin and colicins
VGWAGATSRPTALGRRHIAAFCVALVCAGAALHGAQQASLRIIVTAAGDAPVAGASVVVNGTAYRSDERGQVAVDLPPGTVQIVVAKEGLNPATVSVELSPGETRTVPIALEPQATMEEHVVVAATRAGRTAEEEPTRVDVIDRDEIEEKSMMTPGDIVMMLNETGGLRVQATSPSLGASSIRIQGMRGRYTRFLADGLPLYGEQIGAIGLLQIPPADLGQVEIIKGVASSLYGAGAMGGVVNLVSKRPGDKAERELLLNRSSRGATDGVLYLAGPIADNWGATLIAGAHGQERTDVDGDGWGDLPTYARGVVRPRLFWDDKAGHSVFATVGVTAEDRTGGTMAGEAPPPIDAPYTEALDTRRVDAGVVAQALVGGRYVAVARGSFVRQREDRQYGEVVERDTHTSGFTEFTLRGTAPRQTWVVGAAVERDVFDPIDVPAAAFDFTVPGVFAQDEIDVRTWLALSASARVDVHSEYGTFFSPRVSVLFKGDDWSSRAAVGSGFFASTPLTEETEAAGLSRLTIVRPLQAERGTSGSIDFSAGDRPLKGTVTIFASRVRDPIDVDRTNVYALANRPEPSDTFGVDMLGSWIRPPYSLYASYTYVRARDGRGDVPLTPRHTAGVDWAWERPASWRVGLEWYYTGVQALDANPYRDESRPYMVFGALVSRRLGRFRLFLNGENLGDVRQTGWDPLLRPTRGVDGRWTVDAWAPLDGRNINGGVRIAF